ncbi:glycosyltransferase family 4 protein [Halosolutus halophilus]|uniref:glycosyltransferase family 4 protein n=1 Tax=Halosolutus halophilus TaxID=1552990 RepID=UPI0022350E0D|nr:glycosyltransferase family 4 protein [Halosolutus halophilus]
MRVLNSLVEPRIGGPHLRSLAVAKQLREYDVETVFLLPAGSDEFEELATEAGFDVVRPSLPRLHPPKDVVKNLKYMMKYLPATKRICDVIEEYNIDIMYASMTLNFQAVVAAYRSSTPIAWFFNDTSTPWPLTEITAQMAGFMADEIAVAADAVHDYYFSNDVTSRTIYPPVDTEEFNPDKIDQDSVSLREELDIDESTPIIGTVGNINPVKGHKYLLRSLPDVINKIGQVAVPIVGKILDTREEYITELKRLRSDLGLEDNVYFVGQRSDIPRIMADFDIFVLPSVREACPMAVLEAMAMQKPVVATRVGGTAEQIVDGEHGWLVPARSPSVLSNALTEALTNPEKSWQRATAARSRVQEKFSLNQCVESHYKMFKELNNTQSKYD